MIKVYKNVFLGNWKGVKSKVVYIVSIISMLSAENLKWEEDFTISHRGRKIKRNEVVESRIFTRNMWYLSPGRPDGELTHTVKL